MTQLAALPFFLRRSQDVVGPKEITSTTETIHGLLRLEHDQLRIQWRPGRITDRVGLEIRTDRELGPVREVVLPLAALAGARVRWTCRSWPPGRRLVLTAADLLNFEQLGGEGGLVLEHPAELELRLPRASLAQAREFAADLELALSELALQNAESRAALPRPGLPRPDGS